MNTFALGGCAAAGVVTVLLYWRITAYFPSITDYHATAGHENSFGLFILNPLRNPNEQETYSLTIPTSRLKKGITDQEILARFTSGFFGGIFTPEAWFFRTTGFSKTDTRVTKALGELAETPQIWNRSEISRTSTPAFGTLFFGNFLVADCSFVSSSQLEAISAKYGEFTRPPCTYAEFIFGSENGRLLVSHRFEVRRSEGPGSEENIQITFSHVRSTGRPGRLTMPASRTEIARIIFVAAVRDARNRYQIKIAPFEALLQVS
ncbi:hypothetical protein SCUP515_00920 [Seiridium cupressi]